MDTGAHDLLQVAAAFDEVAVDQDALNGEIENPIDSKVLARGLMQDFMERTVVTAKDIARELQKFKVFSGLSFSSLVTLSKTCILEYFPADTALCIQDQAQHLGDAFFVLSGRVEVYRNSRSKVAPDAAKCAITLLEKGRQGLVRHIRRGTVKGQTPTPMGVGASGADEARKSGGDTIEMYLGDLHHTCFAGDMCAVDSFFSTVQEVFASSCISQTSCIALRVDMRSLTARDSTGNTLDKEKLRMRLFRPVFARRLLRLDPSSRTESDLDAMAELLQATPFLGKGADKRAKRALLQSFVLKRVPPEQIIIQQGTKGSSWYFILSGKVSVHVLKEDRDDSSDSVMDRPAAGTAKTSLIKGLTMAAEQSREGTPEAENLGKAVDLEGWKEGRVTRETAFGDSVRVLTSNESFGEMAAASEAHERSASCISDTIVDLLEVDGDSYNQLMGGRFKSVFQLGRWRTVLQSEDKDRSDEDRRLLPFMLNTLRYLQQLPETAIQKIAPKCRLKSLPAGHVLMSQNASADVDDKNDDTCALVSVVVTGELLVHKLTPADRAAQIALSSPLARRSSSRRLLGDSSPTSPAGGGSPSSPSKSRMRRSPSIVADLSHSSSPNKQNRTFDSPTTSSNAVLNRSPSQLARNASLLPSFRSSKADMMLVPDLNAWNEFAGKGLEQQNRIMRNRKLAEIFGGYVGVIGFGGGCGDSCHLNTQGRRPFSVIAVAQTDIITFPLSALLVALSPLEYPPRQLLEASAASNMLDIAPKNRNDDELHGIWSLFRNSHFFHQIPKSCVVELFRKGIYKRLDADEILRLQGEQSKQAYLVLSGSVSTHVRAQGIDHKRKKHIMNKIRSVGAARLRMAQLGTPKTGSDASSILTGGKKKNLLGTPMSRQRNKKPVPKLAAVIESVQDKSQQSENEESHSTRPTSLREFVGGEAVAQVLGPCVRVLGPGSVAGQVVILEDNLASPCSIVSREDTEVLILEGSLLRNLNLLQVKLLFQPLSDIAVMDVPPELRDDAACTSIVRMLLPTVQKTQSHLSDLPLSVWFEVGKRALHVSHPAGQVLFRQNDPGIHWYAVMQGSVGVFIQQEGGARGLAAGPNNVSKNIVPKADKPVMRLKMESKKKISAENKQPSSESLESGNMTASMKQRRMTLNMSTIIQNSSKSLLDLTSKGGDLNSEAPPTPGAIDEDGEGGSEDSLEAPIESPRSGFERLGRSDSMDAKRTADIVGMSLGKHVATMRVGQAFGEIALTSESCTRTASCAALVKTDVLLLSKQDYLRSIHIHEKERVSNAVEFFQTISAFKEWSVPNLRALANQVQQHQIPRGDHVVQQGSHIDGIILFQSGEAKLTVARQWRGVDHSISSKVSDGMEKEWNPNTALKKPRMGVLSQDLCILGSRAVVGRIHPVLKHEDPELKEFPYNLVAQSACTILEFKFSDIDRLDTATRTELSNMLKQINDQVNQRKSLPPAEEQLRAMNLVVPRKSNTKSLQLHRGSDVLRIFANQFASGNSGPSVRVRARQSSTSRKAAHMHAAWYSEHDKMIKQGSQQAQAERPKTAITEAMKSYTHVPRSAALLSVADGIASNSSDVEHLLRDPSMGGQMANPVAGAGARRQPSRAKSSQPSLLPAISYHSEARASRLSRPESTPPMPMPGVEHASGVHDGRRSQSSLGHSLHLPYNAAVNEHGPSRSIVTDAISGNPISNPAWKEKMKRSGVVDDILTEHSESRALAMHNVQKRMASNYAAQAKTESVDQMGHGKFKLGVPAPLRVAGKGPRMVDGSLMAEVTGHKPIKVEVMRVGQGHAPAGIFDPSGDAVPAEIVGKGAAYIQPIAGVLKGERPMLARPAR